MARTTEAGRFIGRSAELVRLDDALSAAVGGGGGRTVVIGGEAGIGKTWLLERFATAAKERGAHVLAGACLEVGGHGVPYAPFVEALRGLVRSVDPGRLPAVLGPDRRQLARLLPELGDRPADVSDQLEFDRNGQARLFELVLGIVERLARSSTVVLVIEDLQWADDATRDLLAFLVRNVRTSPTVCVISVRTDQLARRPRVLGFLAELERDASVERLELEAFGRDEMAELAAARIGSASGKRFVDQLLDRSGGNPFYADQLLASTGRGGDGTLPPQLHDILLARVAVLPLRVQGVLRAAAAAGRRVDDDLLAVVLRLSDREVAAALRLAIAEGILVEVDGPDGLPVGYAFRHALLREVVYGVLLAGERVRLHAAFASALAERGSVGGLPVEASELAYLWDAARDYRRAVPCLVEAGGAAERAFAFADAARHYERALELWDRAGLAALPAGVDRVALLERAAECAVLTGTYSHAVELGRTAIATLEADPVHDPVRLGWLHDRLRWYLWEAGDLPAAAAAVEEALRLLPADPPSAARARALAQAAGLRMLAGELPEAARLAKEALGAARAADALGEEALALGIIGWCSAVLGDVDGGVAIFREGLAVAQRLDGPEGIALGYANLAALLDRVGRTEASLQVAYEGFEVIRRIGVIRTYGGVLMGHAAKALFDLGRWDEAIAAVDEGLDLDPAGRPAVWLHINRARLDTNQGRLEAAATHLAQAQTVAEAIGLADAYRAQLLAGLAELARAERRLDDVRHVAEIAISELRDDRPPDPAIGWLAANALRAEADQAESGRARRDAAVVEGAAHRAAVISAWLDRAAAIAIGASDGRRAAIDGLCRAELARLAGRRDPDAWREVATRWEVLGRPYPAAYGWYRQAEAILGVRGSWADAARALQVAASTCRRLGAAPLMAEIERLARHARVRLDGPEPDVSAVPAATALPADSPWSDLGLTDREIEVLRLVAGGWSNRQIAADLFISPKTASVHVSNILGKFGVENRVEAAAVAHRLGLADDAPPPPERGPS